MADNVGYTPGSGANVATDEVTGTGEHVQLFKLAYSADGSRTLVQVDADGALVNLGANNDVVATPAAPGYDSGRVTLPDTLTVLTGSTIRARGVALCNLTSAAQTVTVTNTAGEYFLKDFPLQASMSVYVELGAATMVGVKWNAGAAASVSAQLVGET